MKRGYLQMKKLKLMLLLLILCLNLSIVPSFQNNNTAIQPLSSDNIVEEIWGM